MMINRMPFVVVLVLLATLHSHAQLRLSSQISDGAVLQQDQEVTLWGWANPGASVDVRPSWIKRVLNTKAAQDGVWEVKVRTPAAHLKKTHSLDVRSAGAKITSRDILMGEVWVCSGQSNMQMSLGRIRRTVETEKDSDGVQESELSVIRMHVVPQHYTASPVASTEGTWVVGSPKNSLRMSAVGWLFAKRLYRKLRVPVGMIHTSWGGTPAEAWTSASKLAEIGEFGKTLSKLKEATSRKGFNHRTASTLYNAMIHPLLRCRFRGAIWYQGESNVSRAEQYNRVFPAMIEDWRAAFDCGEFPFYFIQIAPFDYKNRGESAFLREAQLKSLRVPATGMAVAMDVGNPTDIHPIRKAPLANRLANMALTRVYGLDVGLDSGPFYESFTTKGRKLILEFTKTGGKLVLREPADDIFQLAGEDQVFHPASALVVGDKLHLESPKVKSPIAARYGWSNAPKAALFNRKRLPASSFRTDSWQD